MAGTKGSSCYLSRQPLRVVPFNIIFTGIFVFPFTGLYNEEAGYGVSSDVGKAHGMKVSLTLILMFMLVVVRAQDVTPTLRIAAPTQSPALVNAPKQFITGVTCRQCTLTINDEPVKVHATGTFARELKLEPGTSTFRIKASAGKKSIDRTVTFEYSIPLPNLPVDKPGIASVQVFPEGNLILQPGDPVYLEVKAYPGSVVTVDGTLLYELPVGSGASVSGIYKGIYVMSENDSIPRKLTVTLTSKNGDVYTKQSAHTLATMSFYGSDALRTTTRLAHLKYGWGDDRLGGAKIGYVDSLIPMKILGKAGRDYKVQLSPGRSAYIESDYVELLPRGYTLPPVLTSKMTISGDEKYDYLKMALPRRLPYESRQLVTPAAIEIDVHGAVNNTNWITQLASAKEISRVEYTQPSDEVFRITIFLKHPFHWGYSVYYEGNALVVRVKQQPVHLQLKNLVIAVDAGHGGTNTGAQGLTGVIEKNVVLDISLKLKAALEREGAKVIMTRTKEQFVENRQRILFYRDSTPDILLSIHLNSAVDPLNAGGTMMFYRYPGFRMLNEVLYKRMQELGLRPGGITGSFNFMLNSPTEYPNALVEALFLSNLEEEALVVEEAFRVRMAEKLVEGLKDYLEACRAHQP